MSLNKKMGDAHEAFLCDLLGGRQTKGSGNQWTNPMDGRGNRLTEGFAFAWDGKSTLGQSVAVSRNMWQKAREQAGGERPMVAVRFYDNEALDVHADLIAVNAHDFAEVLEAANQMAAIKEQGCLEGVHKFWDPDGKPSLPGLAERWQGGCPSSTCSVCGADAYNIYGDA